MEIMRVEQKEPNWFSRWEDEELPSPEELMPLSQTLITPDLAVAFDIPTAAANNNNNRSGGSNHDDAAAAPIPPSSALKKPRLVWTPQLHKRFVEAVAHLGIKNAVPKTIMQLMNVDGLTRENVASHLQKYRLYLKRMQHSSAATGASSSSAAAYTATDRLFATAPVPTQFLRPFVPVAAMQHYQQMTAAAAAHQNQYYSHGRAGAMTIPPPQQMGVQRIAVLRPPPPLPTVPPQYVGEELGSGERRGRTVLTLFPTGQD